MTVISMANKLDDGTKQSPKQALELALKDTGNYGAFEKGTKLLVLCLDDTEGGYDISFIQAGMKMSDCVALCEMAKSEFKSIMNY